jgi:hypothetical protein
MRVKSERCSCIIPAIAAELAVGRTERKMKKIFRTRNVLLALAALLVVWMTELAYRKNNLCAPGDHLVQSEADAIKQAKIRFSRARYERHEIFGHFDERPELVAWDQGDDCCKVTTRNVYGVIIWDVSLQGGAEGEATIRRVESVMSLSNCGAVFTDKSSYGQSRLM